MACKVQDRVTEFTPPPINNFEWLTHDLLLFIITRNSKDTNSRRRKRRLCFVFLRIFAIGPGTRPTAAHRYQFHKFQFWGTFNIQLNLKPGAKGIKCDLGTIIKLTIHSSMQTTNNTESTKQFALTHPTRQLWEQENTQPQLLNPFVTTSTSCTKFRAGRKLQTTKVRGAYFDY